MPKSEPRIILRRPRLAGDASLPRLSVVVGFLVCVAILVGVAPSLEAQFVRGDSNDDGQLLLIDPITTLNALFSPGIPLPVPQAADANDNGVVEISDVSYSLNYLFVAGPPPAAPYPAPGYDTTPPTFSTTPSGVVGFELSVVAAAPGDTVSVPFSITNTVAIEAFSVRAELSPDLTYVSTNLSSLADLLGQLPDFVRGEETAGVYELGVLFDFEGAAPLAAGSSQAVIELELDVSGTAHGSTTLPIRLINDPQASPPSYNLASVGGQAEVAMTSNGGVMVEGCFRAELAAQELVPGETLPGPGDVDSVSVSGDRMAVGMHFEQQVNIYQRDANGEWLLEQEIVSTTFPLPVFGMAVALEGDDLVVSGAVSAPYNGVWFYRFDGGQWIETQSVLGVGTSFGYPMSMGGDVAVISDTEEERVHVYRQVGGVWGEEAILEAPVTPTSPAFGYSVDCSGDFIAVGDFSASTGSVETGLVHLYEWDGDDWNRQTLSASDGAQDDRFGMSVAVDGDLLIAGAPGWTGHSDRHSAYVFRRIAGAWVEEERLWSPSPTDSAFGRTVAVGDDQLAVSSGASAGFSYRWNGDAWKRTTLFTMDESQGNRVAIDGDAAFTARDDSLSFFDLTSPSVQGLAPSPSADALMGTVSSLAGDVAVFGAPRDGNMGSVAVYQPDALGWQLVADLTPPDGTAGDRFGRSVSTDGDRIAVGSPVHDGAANNAGCVYVYARMTGDWLLEAQLTASDAGAADRFGRSVAIEGGRLVVGAPRDDDAGSKAGAIYVFQLSGGNWVEQFKLTASDGAPGDLLGQSVSLEGDRILVGAPYDDDGASNSGSVYFFRYTHYGMIWYEEQKLAGWAEGNGRYGHAVSLSGDRAVIGSPWVDLGTTDRGAAQVLRREATGWIIEDTLIAGDGTSGDQFGFDVSIDGERIAVGARHDDDEGTNSGSVTVYSLLGEHWNPDLKLTEPGALGFEKFGQSVSLSGPRLVVGSPYKAGVGTEDGNGTIFGIGECEQ